MTHVPTLGGADRLFLDCLQSLARRPEARHGVVTVIGEELDFLATICRPDQFSPVQADCLRALRRLPPGQEVAAVLTVRDEGIYLLEWLAHHRLLGIAEIFIYTNDNTDNSDRLLAALARAGVCHVIRNRIGPGVNPQRKSYQHALLLQPRLRDFRWVLFADADEFLLLDDSGEMTLPRFLAGVPARFPGDPPAAVVFPWHWRHTDLEFSRIATTVLDAYPHATVHRNVKPVVDLSQALGMCEVHLPTIGGEAFIVDPQFNVIPKERLWDGIPAGPSSPRIEHFWAKSFVEFTTKIRRGEQLALANGDFRRDAALFFAWNPPDTPDSHRPLPARTIARVREKMAALLRFPGVQAAYDEVVRTHLAWRHAAEQNPALRACYARLRAEAGG